MADNKNHTDHLDHLLCFTICRIIKTTEFLPILLIGLIGFACSSQNTSPKEPESKLMNDSIIEIIDKPDNPGILINNNIDLSELLDSSKLKSSKIHIEIDKSDYILSVVSDSEVIKQYRVVLGDNPIDDKLIEGDRCTPEGTFKIVTKYPHRLWSKFILLDYPNAASIEKFNEAKKAGTIPKDATPGNDIGIHGVPQNDYRMNLGINWTAGCISLKNKDINEIYKIVDTNTLVVIRK